MQLDNFIQRLSLVDPQKLKQYQLMAERAWYRKITKGITLWDYLAPEEAKQNTAPQQPQGNNNA